MSVDYSTSTSGLIGSAERQAAADAATAASSRSSLGKDDFLKLLVTQMQAQDPLNPMDDKEFVAQLAQFSSLEQLTNISGGITKLLNSSGQQTMLAVVGFIGKDVKSLGDTLTKSGSKVSAMSYTLTDTASKVVVNILDSNGNIIRTDDLGSKSSGDQQYQWDGKDWNGKSVADGIYTVAMSAVDASGNPLLANTSVTGTVTGMGTDSSGNFTLKLSDGRSVKFTDIQEVVSNTSTTTGS